MSFIPRKIYYFPPFHLDQAEGVLLRDGKAVSLTPKALGVLLVLVEHNGHIVDKKDLLKQVWPDAFVEEGNLTFNISVLRKTLGKTPSGADYIETVPKRGYRFTAPVEVLGPKQSSTPILWPNNIDRPSVKKRRKWWVLATLVIGLALSA